MDAEKITDIIQKGWNDKNSELDKGFLFLDACINYSGTKLPEDLNEIYECFLDYVLFIEGLQYPFFYRLKRSLSDGNVIKRLVKNIAGKNIQTPTRLNAGEAFDFLCHLDKDFANKNHDENLPRAIFDSYDLPYKVYSQATDALENHDRDAFIDAFHNGDPTEMMKLLWLLRFILYGDTSVKYKKAPDDFYNRVWFNDHAYDIFFYKESYSYNKDTIKEKINSFICSDYHFNPSEYHKILLQETTSKYQFNDNLEKCLLKNIKCYNDELIEHIIKEESFFSYDTLAYYCRENGIGFVLETLNRNEALKKDFDTSFFEELAAKSKKTLFANGTASKLFELYIETCLMRISFAYNMVEDSLSDSSKKFLADVIERFPVLKNIITGSDSLFEIYFTRLFPMGDMNNDKAQTETDNDAKVSERKKIDNHEKYTLGGKSYRIYKLCTGTDNINETYKKALHYLYSFLTGNKLPESYSGDKTKNLKINIEFPVEYIDKNECSEEDFIYIFEGDKDKTKTSENPVINWSYGTEAEMAAFFLVCCGAEKGKDADDDLNPKPGKAGARNCYSFNGKNIKLSEKKRETRKYYDSWSKVLSLCVASAKKQK